MAELKIEVRKDALAQAGRDVIDAWKRIEAGESVAPSDRTYFVDWETLAAVLSSRRMDLLGSLRREPARSLRALARRLGRDVKNVHGDVAALEGIGLIARDDAGRLTAPYAEVTSAIRFAA